jgi:lysyl-tRNA synthetase class 2
MKRLLAEGAKAIFQVTRSFRAHEQGQLHHPEFTIVEWYRVGDDMAAGMWLLDELCQDVLAAPPAKYTSYAELFQHHFDLCPHTCGTEKLVSLTGASPAKVTGNDDRDTWLNLLWGQQIEPNLGESQPEIVYDFPASQAALARIRHAPNDPPVAERFELYYRGIELANGYHELTDAAELRSRLEQVNAARALRGKNVLPMPESLLVGASSIQEGINSD